MSRHAMQEGSGICSWAGGYTSGRTEVAQFGEMSPGCENGVGLGEANSEMSNPV